MTTRGDSASRALAFAWAESPLQILNIAEYCASTNTATRLGVRAGVAGLLSLVEALDAHLPPDIVAVEVRSAPWRSTRTADTLVVGDVLSGQVKSWISAHPRPNVVIVDDGSAALDTATRLANDAPLKRHASRSPFLDNLASSLAARRLRRARTRGAVTAFTAYASSREFEAFARSGARVLANDYAWLRSLPPLGGQIRADMVVVGSALAADGHIFEDSYRRWLAGASAGSSTLYMPHRRELPEVVAGYARELELSIANTDLPVELALAGVSRGTRVATLPSSVVATLHAVFPHLELTVARIEDSWWTPGADPSVRSMAEAVAHGR
jgi:hypothetical protein